MTTKTATDDAPITPDVIYSEGNERFSSMFAPEINDPVTEATSIAPASFAVRSLASSARENLRFSPL